MREASKCVKRCSKSPERRDVTWSHSEDQMVFVAQGRPHPAGEGGGPRLM